jgi:excisionase family DNA binding protein
MPETPPPNEARLTVADAVRITGLSADTIRRYSNDGKLPTFRTPANHRRFTETDVRALVKPAALIGGAAA